MPDLPFTELYNLRLIKFSEPQLSPLKPGDNTTTTPSLARLHRMLPEIPIPGAVGEGGLALKEDQGFVSVFVRE